MTRLRQLQAIERDVAAEGIGDVTATAECCPTRYCRVDQLIIRCAHDERRYKLTVDTGRSAATPPLLETLATSAHPEELHIWSSGQCGFGRPATAADALLAQRAIRNSRDYCPSVVVRGPGIDVIRPGELKVRLPAPEVPLPRDDLAGFFLSGLLPQRRSHDYVISAWGCQGEPGGVLARVRVHTRQFWKAAFTLSYLPGRRKETQSTRTAGGFRWNGRLEAGFGDHQWRKSGGGKRHGDREQPESGILTTLQNILEDKLAMLQDLAGDSVRVGIEWPSIRFNGSLQRCEAGDGPEVGNEWDIRLSLSPLLGAELRVDIVDFLIRSGNPYGAVLGRIKDRLRQGIGGDHAGVHADLALLLTAGGRIGGDLRWRQPLHGDAQWEGMVQAGLRFGGEASVDVSGALFIVSMAGQAAIKARAATGAAQLSEISGYWSAACSDGEPALHGGLRFNGLAVYYTLFLNIGVEEIRDRPPADGDAPLQLHRLQDDPQVTERDEERLFTLLEPWQWPAGDNDATLPLGNYLTG